MKRKKLEIKDKKIKKLLKNKGREGAEKDFFELLKRAVKKS